MNENNLRALLHDIADRPEPAARIDIDRARRRGLRRLWARRAALPVAVAAALALAFVIPETLTSAAPGHSGVVNGATASATAKSVQPKPKSKATQASVPSPDGYLNPLVPYAAFGDLPPGYALDVTPSAIHDGFVSTVDNLTITAAQSAGGDFIQLSVMPKGGCYGLLGGIPGWSATQDQQARCSELTGQASGRAPAVRGRIAYWGNGGTDLAWQYAPDSWAVLQAQGSGEHAVPRRRGEGTAAPAGRERAVRPDQADRLPVQAAPVRCPRTGTRSRRRTPSPPLASTSRTSSTWHRTPTTRPTG